jgi:multicomponent Na+:H+ antiporter subunit D
MTMSFINLPPAFILLIGALLVPLLPKNWRNGFVILLPLLGFIQISQLEHGNLLTLPFLDYGLDLLRVDKLSKAFGYIFTLSAFAAFIYGYCVKKHLEHIVGLLYVGSALGVVFAGDLLSLYLFWEVMAITSAFLILARQTTRARIAATRYVLVHVVGGLVLLAGILLQVKATGSLEFSGFTEITLATSLILVGFLVNAAAIPFSSWLPDAYPEATVLGGVILSAYTSKTAVYTLLRGFSGWEILIVIGCAMTLYGIYYALLENDMRRILGYSIVSQVGFMVCAAGIGTPLAIAGAVAHAFCHILYKALLWMSTGAVLYRTGKSKCTELGGLYNTMPWTVVLGLVGALAISAPLTSGYTSKTIIILAAENQGLFWIWFILEVASAGVFLQAGIQFPYFVFFAKDKGLRPPEAPGSMLFGMGILAFLCIYLGCFPARLYEILPYSDLVKSAMPVAFLDIYVVNFGRVISQSQLLIFSGLVFFLFLPLFKRTDTVSIDVDWFYRRGARRFYDVMARGLNGVNSLADRLIAQEFVGKIAKFISQGPGWVLSLLLAPIWILKNLALQEQREKASEILRNVEAGTLPIGLSAMGALLLLAILFMV